MLKRNLAVLLILLSIGSIGMASFHEEVFHARCEIEKSGSLSLYNATGNISITQWSKDYVDITAVKKTSYLASELKKVDIEIDQTKHTVIKSVYLSHNARVAVDYTIKIPAGVKLDRIENVTGDVVIEGAAACIGAKTVTGDLKVRCASGPLRAECVTGNVTVYVEDLDDNATYKTITGHIDAYLQPKLNATLDLSIVTGKIANHGLRISLDDFTEISAKQLRGLLGTGGIVIRLEVITGGINLYKTDG